MEEILVIGAGPAGLLAAWVARQRGARVRVIGAGIGTTHIMPGWLALADTDGPLEAAVRRLSEQAGHPYSIAGWDAVRSGVAALQEVCRQTGLTYVGDLQRNYRLPTALGAVAQAALVPESFAAGDLTTGEPALIAAPEGWRDFYPELCAENLRRKGIPARSATFELPEMFASKFDSTAANMARILHNPDVRGRVAVELRAKLDGAARVGMPAILGLEEHTTVWREMQDRLGVPLFEIPTLPPSVPGMRLWLAFKAAFMAAAIQLLLDMEVSRGVVEEGRARGAAVAGAARETVFRADTVILATGGLYGGGISSNHRGELRETVFGLPLAAPPGTLGDWFGERLLAADHPVHRAGLRINATMQPTDEGGNIALQGVRVAGRLLAGYNPLIEGSAEGVWLASAYCAATA